MIGSVVEEVQDLGFPVWVQFLVGMIVVMTVIAAAARKPPLVWAIHWIAWVLNQIIGVPLEAAQDRRFREKRLPLIREEVEPVRRAATQAAALSARASREARATRLELHLHMETEGDTIARIDKTTSETIAKLVEQDASFAEHVAEDRVLADRVDEIAGKVGLGDAIPGERS